MALPKDNPAVEGYAQKIANYQTKIIGYDQEKKDIQAKAHDLERQRDDAKLHGKPFGMAVIFLQIAIMLNAIAGLMKAQRIWWSSIPVGLAGVVLFADGFLTFF